MKNHSDPGPHQRRREQWNVKTTASGRSSVQDVKSDFERLRSQEEPWSPLATIEDTAQRRIACEN